MPLSNVNEKREGGDATTVTALPSSIATANGSAASQAPVPDAIILDPAQLPSWQRPFVLGPNVRFTRTPGRGSLSRPKQSVEALASIPRPQEAVPAQRAGHGAQEARAASPARVLQQYLDGAIEAEGPRLQLPPSQPALPTGSVPQRLALQGPVQAALAHDRPVVSRVVEVHSRDTTLNAAGGDTASPAPLAMPDHLVWEMLSLGVAEIHLQQEPEAKPQQLAESTTADVRERELSAQLISQPAPVCDAVPRQHQPLQVDRLVSRSPIDLYRQVAVRTPGAAKGETAQQIEALAAVDLRPAERVADGPIGPSRPPISASAPAQAEDYLFPPVDLLQPASRIESEGMSPEALEKSAGLLESVLEDFGIKGDIIDVRPGPVVTLYEFAPAPGVKSSRIINLSDDIARSMSALSARVAVVPGRNVIGIELPNPQRETVFLRELIESSSYIGTDYRLPLCLGKTIGGEPVIAELAKMPHLLVAGTTGSGKSVAINTMILSLIYHLRPDECRLIMVDPKMLELSVYDGIPHLLTPVVTDSKKAILALKWAVREMEERYRKMSRLGVRNIDGFNMRVAEARRKGETILVSVPCGFDRSTGQELFEQQELDLAPLPYIVVIVDEMADLMMVAGKEIEGAIQRLAQMARAAGIHLIMATQRPSVDVITGTIKANFPTRVSFQVTSKIDSRTILGEQGAEHLLGQGDMLLMKGGGRISRVHGPFVSDYEVEKVVAHLKSQGQPSYLGGVTEEVEAGDEGDEEPAVFDQTSMGGEASSDELYERAVKVVQRDSKCSTSYIQRRLSIGYNRAASLVERMEHEGLVGPPNHVGKREILGSRAQPDPDDG